MDIRTYYWHARVVSKLKVLKNKLRGVDRSNYFVTGNAGDIFTKDIINHIYSLESKNVKNEGGRLLVVGSIANVIRSGDLLCGIGVKHREIPKASDGRCKIEGLRGPISYDVFKAAGHDVSDVKFLLDPGLLARFIARRRVRHAPKGVIFIPHYREKTLYEKSLPSNMSLVDIDAHPLDVFRKIEEAELVYSSSLHGIIFAHALNRPCVFVKPQTEEPILKYKDYYASINQDYIEPLDSIYDANYKSSPISPLSLNYKKEDFIFPSLKSLIELGIAR